MYKMYIVLLKLVLNTNQLIMYIDDYVFKFLLQMNVGDSYIHVRVWKKLDGNTVVSRVQTGKSVSDPIEYF